MKIIIVGGVAGGASAAARLRRLDEEAEIILLERGGFISFANCGLPYYIGGETSGADLTVQTPESFRARFNVDVRTLNEAVEIDAENKSVLVRDSSNGREYRENYDKLVLSPGAEPVRPQIKGVDDRRVFTLRTIPDADKIRAFVEENSPKRALVVGGGFVGLETAENLMKLGLEVTIVEFADHIIAPLDFDTAAEVQNYLRLKGVNLWLRRAVKALYPTKKIIGAELDDRTVLEAEMVVLAVGVRPDTEIAKKAGLATNERGAIKVDGRMRTSDPNIYAVGDAVAVTNAVTGKEAYIPLAGPANKQGRIAADNICGLESAYNGSQGSGILKFFDLAAASTGLNESAAKSAGIDCDKVYVRTASHAPYYPGAEQMLIKTLFEKKSGRILGAQVVGGSGADKRCDLLAVAVRNKLTAFDLTEMELCYAPPFSSAKDPVNVVGFAIENILTGKVRQFHWNEIPAILANENAILLDVRTEAEYAAGNIAGARNIPLDNLRERLGELDKSKTIYVHCRSGQRSYLACRILTQNGFDCLNLAGGYLLYESATKNLGPNE